MRHFSKTTKMLAILLAGSVLLASCASTTMIQSEPSGAKVYIDGQPAGTTPYYHTDTKIVGSNTMVRLEKEGYETLNTRFSRTEQPDVGAIIGGLFVWVPFLWVMKYDPVHSYKLTPTLEPVQYDNKKAPATENINSKESRLQQLKELYEKELITKDEYDAQRKKILEE